MAGVTQHDGADNNLEDVFGEECSPNAKLWQVYMNEAQILDNAMTKELSENADVLLVFSGLFSAVVTGFVAITSQSLQMDYAPVTAELMFEMVQLQRAALNGSDGASVQSSSWTPTASFSPSSTDVWVNGLWFTSLTVSLIAALMAVLSKQWVSYYVSKPPGSGTALDQVRIRQFRYTNFQKWSIPVIIGVLPFLLHIALVMFLVGLVVFLSAFISSLASTIATLTVLAVLAYTATVILSTVDPSCPYRTPLSTILYSLSHQFFPNNSPSESTLSAMEQRTIEKGIDSLDAGAILWLLRTSSNATVRAFVIEAMANVRPAIVPNLSRALVFEHAVWEQYHELLKDSLIHAGFLNYHEPKTGCENRVHRLIEVQRRLAPARIIAFEAPLTSCMVPRGFFQYDYNASSLLALSLLEMQGAGREMNRPVGWLSPAQLLSRLIQSGCKLPWHTWQDYFAHIDLASVCVLRAAHIPDAESFCATYLWSHAKRSELNDDLPQSTKLTEWTKTSTFIEILPHFEEQIAKAILTQFLPSGMLNHNISIHAQVIISVINHLLSSALGTRLIGEASCYQCRALFVNALGSMCTVLSKSSLSLGDSAAFKDVIWRILSSDLFAVHEGDQKDNGLWSVRRQTLVTMCLMRADSTRRALRVVPHGHQWPISEDCVNSFIRLALHAHSVDCMSHERMHSNLELTQMISQHWFTSDVDTTYSTFLEVDAFVFLAHTKYLFYGNISLIAAYVQGLLRAKDNGTYIDLYTEYLFRPANLCTALLLVAGKFALIPASHDVVKSLLIRIVKLCPFKDPQDAQSCWTTALQSLDTFSNKPNNTEHEFWHHNDKRKVSYTPEGLAQIKSRVKYWRNFLAGYIERLQSDSLEPGDEIDVPFRLE